MGSQNPEMSSVKILFGQNFLKILLALVRMLLIVKVKNENV